MSVSAKFNEAQLASLRSAIGRNQQKVKDEVNNFLVRGIRAYNTSIIRSPWRVGEQEGGAPVATGNLRDRHVRKIGLFEASIIPLAKYSVYVHEGTKRMTARPWLDYAKQSKQAEIDKLSDDLLLNITNDLAK